MTIVVCPKGQEMVLVKCQKCHNPIGRLKPGSEGEFKCRACLIKTYIEVKAG